MSIFRICLNGRKSLLELSNRSTTGELILFIICLDRADERFLPYLRRALQGLIRRYEPTYLYTSASFSTASSASSSSSLITRDFSIAFYNLPLTSGIRDLRMDRIGQLMSISGTVTRTSEVRPELVSGTFTCETCRTTISDVEQQFKYTEVRWNT